MNTAAPEAPSLPAKAETPAAELSEHDRARGYVRPHRDAVVHVQGEGRRCPVTILPRDHAAMHARTPGLLTTMKCTACRATFPASAFVWHGSSERVG
jgi:hypothetical protein